jgi:hypothetical protein
MIAGFIGSNIEGVFHPDRKEDLNAYWDKLPKTVKDLGETPESIFAGWQQVEDIVGKNEMENVPFGAVALWTLADKLKAGLQQFMAGARKFNLDAIDRSDIMAGNRKTAKELETIGIPYMTKAMDKEAKEILKK